MCTLRGWEVVKEKKKKRKEKLGGMNGASCWIVRDEHLTDAAAAAAGSNSVRVGEGGGVGKVWRVVGTCFASFIFSFVRNVW